MLAILVVCACCLVAACGRVAIEPLTLPAGAGNEPNFAIRFRTNANRNNERGDVDDVEVVVHPQSTVHSLIRLTDGALLAHLADTSMRHPIEYALTHPERADRPDATFDLTGLSLTFERPDTDTFRALALAYEAGRAGGSAPAVYNAADEVAVAAFLQRRLGFTGIPRIIEATMMAPALMSGLCGSPWAAFEKSSIDSLILPSLNSTSIPMACLVIASWLRF